MRWGLVGRERSGADRSDWCCGRGGMAPGAGGIEGPGEGYEKYSDPGGVTPGGGTPPVGRWRQHRDDGAKCQQAHPGSPSHQHARGTAGREGHWSGGERGDVVDLKAQRGQRQARRQWG